MLFTQSMFGFGNQGSSGGGGGSVSFNSKTYAEMQALIAGSGLTPGSFYKITDRGDLGIILQAISSNQLSEEGVRLMLCPSFYGTGNPGDGSNWIGVWDNTKSVLVNDYAVWGGMVWQNTSGNIGGADNDTTLSALDWVVVAKAINNQYTEKTFGVLYDFANDWICKQWDDGGNVLGVDFNTYNTISPILGINFNYCDVSDWNMLAGNAGLFQDNECFGIYNNTSSSIYGNKLLMQSPNFSVGGAIYDNNCSEIGGNICNGEIARNAMNGGIIIYNSNNGIIADNTCGEISYNSNNGYIQANGDNITGEQISRNSNNGYIGQNQSMATLNGNSNNGNIYQNHFNGGGDLSNNSNSGDINTNTVSVINGNKNAGGIADNTGSTSSILNNSNIGFINNNNVNNIFRNTNVGGITANTVTTEISDNSNVGEISNNSNTGTITNNENNGSISGNDIQGSITQNLNNGFISLNTSSVAVNITTNVNNGFIGAASAPAVNRVADVTDPVTNK